jgi:predicted transcriptional regulator
MTPTIQTIHKIAEDERPKARLSGTPVCDRQAYSSLEHLPGRIRDIAVLRGLGYSYREIARPLGVTPQAVSLMLMRHKRCLRELRDSADLHSLSARAVNVLTRHRVRTRAEAREKHLLHLIQSERNCGAKTIAEIERWMGEGNYVSAPN